MVRRDTDNRRIIGDDWIFDEIVQDASGRGIPFAGMEISITYLAPAGTTPAEVDITDDCIADVNEVGGVRFIVPHDVTGTITVLPAGRKYPTAYIRFGMTGPTGLRQTYLVIPITPISVADAARPPSSGFRNDSNYHRAREYGGTTIL